ARRTRSQVEELRHVHADRYHPLDSTHAGGRPDFVPARGPARIDVHVPAAGAYARFQSERLDDRRRRSIRDHPRRRAGNHDFRQVFEINVNTDGRTPMVYAPQTQSGSFFNDQERTVHGFQWVEALTFSRNWHGEHVFKFGGDLQWSRFDGFSESRPLEI